jgi:hypothetical protein
MRGSLRADITSRPWTIDGFDAVSHKFTRYLYLSDRAHVVSWPRFVSPSTVPFTWEP